MVSRFLLWIFMLTTSLVSHFTIASDGREYLRVRSVKLDEGDQRDYQVESARREWDAQSVGLTPPWIGSEAESKVVTPNQPLSCLFKIHKKSSGKLPFFYIGF